MARAPKGKVGVYVLIDAKVYEEVKRLAFQKHERLHGALSREVEEALRHWISLCKQTQSNPRAKAPKVYEVFEAVKDYLKKNYDYEVVSGKTEVARAHIVEAIMALRGYDKRTVNTWIERFLNARLIEQVGPGAFRVL